MTEVDDLYKNCLELIENLPDKVARESKRIRNLDIKNQEMNSEIKTRLLAYLKTWKKMDRNDRLNELDEIDKLFVEARKIAQEKVTVATNLYDSIDNDINEMDGARRLVDETYSVKRKVQSDEAGTSTGGRKKKKKAAEEEEVQYKTMSIVPSIEMPVDPNEPIYCDCHQASWGEMIKCDNPTCKVEWFHFQCAGVDKAPPGDWYCHHCLPFMKNKKKKGG